MTAADTIKDLHVEVKRCPECGTGFGREAAFCPFDGIALKAGTWDPTRDPLTATVIDHRYEVVEPLGEGGMGTVYKVRHTTLDCLFAMKVLRRDLAADGMLAARFLQEARATAAVRHPSVVAINDFGELDDGAPYFVMELLVGETLATRLRARGLLPPREAAAIACKLADALAAAHAANVVHRDLKPENVFLVGKATGKTAADDVRIVDFGAAKIMGGSKLTRPGVVFGTPYYMSPEQASGATVDARADIYSLGVLLYEMVTGALPFEADTYMGVLTKHMFAAPGKPSERVPAGTQLGDLDAVVLRALEKDPDARYATMGELASAIAHAVEGRASASPAAVSASGRHLAFTGAPSTADRIQQSVSRHVEEERRRRRKGIVVAAVSAAATLTLCAAVVALLDESKASKAAASSKTTKEGASAPVTNVVAATAPTTSIAVPMPMPMPMPVPAPTSSAPTPVTATMETAATTTGTPAPPPPTSNPPPSMPPPSRAPSVTGTSAAGATPAKPAASPVRTAAPPPPRPRSPDDIPDPWRH